MLNGLVVCRFKKIYIFILDHLLELLFWTINLAHLLELSFFQSSKTHFLTVQILHLRFWAAKFWTMYWRCSKGYRCYDPVSHRVITSRHVYFDVCHFPFAQE